MEPRPQVALGLLILAAAFPFRFNVGGGYTASILDVAVGVGIVPLLFMAAVPGVLTWPPRSLVVAAAVPSALTLLSLVWTRSFTQSALWLVSWLECLVVLLLVSTVLRDQYPRIVVRWIARFGVLLLVPPVLMYAGAAAFQPPASIDPASGDYLSYFARFSHPFIGRSNNIATLLGVLFVPLVYWSARYRTHRLATVLIGSAVLLTLSRGVILAVAIASILLVVRSREQAGRVTRRLAAPLIVGAVLLVAAVIYNPIIAENITSRLDTSNVAARSSLLSTAWAAVSISPLLGQGAGVGENVHNTYVQQVVYFGIPLGALAAWFIARAARSLFAHGDLGRAAGLGIVAALVSFLVESSLEGVLLRPELFLCFGLVAALATSSRVVGSSDLDEDPRGDGGEVGRGRERRGRALVTDRAEKSSNAARCTRPLGW
jgi:O-antigen ligase